MAEQKTKQTDESVSAFIDNSEPASRRDDCYALINLMEKASGYPAKMWGTSIIGFGFYHYKYASGHEGDAPLVGFSPRKQAISLYVVPCREGFEELLAQLGKYKMAKACIYVNKLTDINTAILEKLIKRSIKYLKEWYP